MHGRYMSLLCSWSSFRYFLSFSFPLLPCLLACLYNALRFYVLYLLHWKKSMFEYIGGYMDIHEVLATVERSG